MSRLRRWWRVVQWRRAQRKRLDALLESIEKRTPVYGQPGISPEPYETWDEFVDRIGRP